MSNGLERHRLESTSFEIGGSGGLKKTKWKSMNNENVDITITGDDAINNIGRWIEDCTGHMRTRQSLLEFLEDGVILCELVESIRPGVIKKINRVKNRFAYWENFSFFLDSCRSLGLQEWQLFDPELVLCRQSGKSPSKEPPEKKLQNIVTTLYWLAQTVQLLPGYTGPELDLSCLITKSTTTTADNCGSTGSISTCGESSITPGSTPEHKSLSVSSPSTDYPLPSPGLTSSGTDSPLLWVQKLSGGGTTTKQDSYHFTTPLQFDDSPNSQTSTGSTDCNETFPIKKRRETLSVLVEAHNPPSAFSADLVFVQENTNSSVLSPTSQGQLVDSVVTNNTVQYSPHHLSNTFGASDQIDNTGLLIDPNNFHSQVFTGVSGSQDSSEPHFSSQRSETTFHVNLTQTSQPDNLSNYGTQPDAHCYPPPQELPSISELANNSSPIDTFDLHHSRRPVVITTSNQTILQPQIEYSCSQEYSDRYSTPQLIQDDQQSSPPPTHSSSSFQQDNSINSSVNTTPRQLENSTGGIDSSNVSSNTSLIVVSYTNNNNTPSSSTKTDSSPSTSSCSSPEKRLPYRRYSSPQQRLFYTTTNNTNNTTNGTTTNTYNTTTSINNTTDNTITSTDNTTEDTNTRLLSESDKGEEEEEEDFDLQDMATTDSLIINKHHRSSGRRQMRVVPAAIDNKENTPSLIGGLTTVSSGSINNNVIDIQLILLPGEKTLGFSVSGGDGSPVIVNYVTGDSPSSRAGLNPGDQLLSVNHIPLVSKSHIDVLDILKQGVYQRKLFLSVSRTKSSFHEASASEPIQNGFTSPPPPPSQGSGTANHLSISRLSLDLTRVNSGALPKHMTASKVVYSPPQESPVNRTNTSKLISSNHQDDLLEILSDVNSTAVEISSVDSRLSSSGGGGDLNHSSSLHSVERQSIEEHELEQEVEPEMEQEVEEGLDSRNVGTSGKSQSVTDLPNDKTSLTNEDNISSEDVYKRFYQSHSNVHRKAKKTESLPGIFRTAGRGGGGGGSGIGNDDFNKSRSVSGVGLNLQNVSMEDVHCVSKLQMDQIWQEVESSSSLTSPQELPSPYPPDDDHDIIVHPIDSILSPTITNTGPLQNEDFPDNSNSTVIESSKRLVDRELSVPSTTNVRRNSSSNSSKGIDTLLNMLRSLNEKVGTYDEEEEFKLLEELLQSSKFRKAKDFHDRMRELVTRPSEGPIPHTLRIVPHTRFLRHVLRENMETLSREEEELRRLLRRPQVQSALFCHDKIATQDLYVPSTYFPKSSQDMEDVILSHSALDLHSGSLFVSQEAPLSRDVPSSRKENATIVYLQRSNRPLGCTIYKQGDSVYVGKLLKGCDAEQSCVLREGDELLEINGIALMGKSTDEIIRLMSGEAGKILAFTLIPVHDDTADIDYEEKYVRAHFSYDGEVDEEVPCKELALSFTKGEILEISNQDDPDWWQARKVFDDGGESLPGLIPARQLQQKREVLRESYLLSVANEERNKRKSILSKFSRKKKKKIYYNQGPMSGVFQSVGHEVATYEDVVKLIPDYSRRRPIVLIGAPSVGRRTLMKRLIDSNPRHYSACTPHTTRPMRPGEMNGREYHFLSREEMESDIQSNKFLEYGESRGHLYGVSGKSVKRVIDSMRVPVLDLHPQALKVIGSSGLIPYVIFIASPRLDRLQMTRRVSSEKHRRKLHTSASAEGLNKDLQAFTESELLQLCHASQEIQQEYGHYFDWVIVNDDFQVAADMLIEVARRIEEEPQWIPATWVEEV